MKLQEDYYIPSMQGISYGIVESRGIGTGLYSKWKKEKVIRQSLKTIEIFCS